MGKFQAGECIVGPVRLDLFEFDKKGELYRNSTVQAVDHLGGQTVFQLAEKEQIGVRGGDYHVGKMRSADFLSIRTLTLRRSVQKSAQIIGFVKFIV